MSNQVPEDSILRRHYEQLQRSPKTSAPPKTAEPEAAAAAPKPAPASPPPRPEPASPAPAAPQSSSGGGFFGWLKKLFG